MCVGERDEERDERSNKKIVQLGEKSQLDYSQGENQDVMV